VGLDLGLVETPLNKIWHNVLINKDYRNAQINDPDCQGCPAYTECRGGCRIDENGLYRVDPIVTRDKAKLLAKTQIQDLINSRENEFLSEC
jgi:radical SAM protein with 4Fe4S-binding SPASM domain